MDSGHNILSWLGNLFSAGAIVGTLIGLIPSVAAVVALIWYAIQISESDTVKAWMRERRRRRLMRLHVEASRLELLLADTKDERVLDNIKHLVTHRVEMDASLQQAAKTQGQLPAPDEE
jgi:hypothetical protein